MKTATSPIKTLAESLKQLEYKEPHIHALRFPNYRNLAPNSVLNFASPITALLGRNGTNKSSILHALYGAPKGNSNAEFWFETELDAIPEANEEGLKQSVVHSYRDNKKQLVECIKARAPRSVTDPDYWEPVKPTAAYGFLAGTERVSPINLEVLHLDFRGQLPAFDKYFYFPDEAHLKKRIANARKHSVLRRDYRKQDYLRRRTHRLKEAINAKGTPLTASELSILGYVLEREYDSGIMLEHSFFRGHRGLTILFHNSKIGPKYSDAFAGSGESAATILIHSIEQAKPGTLVLLDEPETSLHPRAQQRILEFLADRAAAKNLQIVIATHSYYLVERLPSKSIRTLIEDAETGRIVVDETMSPREALHENHDSTTR